MIVVAGTAHSVTFSIEEVPVHPLASVTVTVNEPDAVTVLVCVAPPPDQLYELLTGFAVRITLPPSQKLVAPDEVM